MSYIQSIYHIVFRTYRSERTIDAKHERELYAIIMKQTENLKAKLIRIGGMPDHIHLLVSLPSDLSPAKYVQAIKRVLCAFSQIINQLWRAHISDMLCMICHFLTPNCIWGY